MSGCGRIGFDPTAAPGDVSTEGTDGSGGRCDPTAAFGAPVPVAGLSDGAFAEATSRLTDDELTLYLWTSRSGNIDLERATRPAESSPFASVALTELNTGGVEFEPTVSPNQLVLVFHANRAGTGAGDLYLAERGSLASPFTLTGELVGLDTTADEVQPYYGANEIYFSSNRTNDFEIFRAGRLSATTFGVPARVALPGFTTSDEGDPVISRDGLTLYFASNRAGGLGDYDIYVTTRTSTATGFIAPVLLVDLSSVAGEGPSWISPDGCHLYLSSAKAGTPDIYLAARGRCVDCK